jgi:hypothetical protein
MSSRLSLNKLSVALLVTAPLTSDRSELGAVDTEASETGGRFRIFGMLR